LGSSAVQNYAGHIFGLVATSFLLVALLIERVQSHAVGAVASAEVRLARSARRRDRADTATLRGARADIFIPRRKIPSGQPGV